MKTRDQGRIWWWISLICAVVAAVLTGYIIGVNKERQDFIPLKTIKAPEKKEEVSLVTETAPAEENTIPSDDVVEIRPIDMEESCKDIEKNISDFFNYLDKQKYIRHIQEGTRTHEHFKKLIKTLSANPPIPAGEGIDTMIMTKNIFYFYRILDDTDLRLLREILRNEKNSWEMNLDLFFKWFMVDKRCPDSEEVRPPLDVVYQYAGFLLNTIGGRSYLFRRSVEVRLLISYYCILIIHEADKKGKNNYGIDIFPHIASVAREISLYPDFLFQDEYLQNLGRISDYYLKRR